MLTLDPMPAKKPEFVDTYEVDIEFMEGDADGSPHEVIRFPREATLSEPFKSNLEALLRSVQACVKHDRKGRGGIDEVRDVLREYKHIKDWGRFCSNERDPEHDGVDEDDLEGVDEYSGGDVLGYEIPSDETGFYAKYRGLTMSYYDAQGRKGPCEFKLS